MATGANVADKANHFYHDEHATWNDRQKTSREAQFSVFFPVRTQAVVKIQEARFVYAVPVEKLRVVEDQDIALMEYGTAPIHEDPVVVFEGEMIELIIFD